MKHYKLIAEFLLTAFAGGILGAVVQMAAASSGGWYGGSPSAAFGLVSYGLLFWITVCTLRAYHSRCGLHAALLVLSLLIPTLIGYYGSALIWCNPVNEMVLSFGMLMLLPAAAAAWFLRITRRYAVGRIAVRVLGAAALLFDFSSRIGGRPLAILTEIAVFVWFLYITRDVRKEVSPMDQKWGSAPNPA